MQQEQGEGEQEELVSIVCFHTLEPARFSEDRLSFSEQVREGVRQWQRVLCAGRGGRESKSRLDGHSTMQTRQCGTVPVLIRSHY